MTIISRAVRACSALRAEAAAFLRHLIADKPTVRVAVVLAGVAGAIIVINVVLRALDQSFELARLLLVELNLFEENTLVDHYLQALSFLASGLFAFDYIARNNRISMFLSAVYLFVWFDDAATYHERFGSVLADLLSLPAMAGLRAQDTGEVLAWALAGLVLAVLLPWAWQRRGTGDRGVIALVAATFAALVIFGIMFDMVHVMLGSHLGTLIGILEDGGEIVAISATAVIALGLNRFGEDYRRSV